MMVKINAVMCVYGSGDVLPFSIPQLLHHQSVSRILISDGPDQYNRTRGCLVYDPPVPDILDRYLRSYATKIVYEYSDHHAHRARKVNAILPKVEEDCDWILVVDSDEVWSHRALDALVEFLEEGPEFGRYSVNSINPFPDFFHHFEVDDRKPRVFRWFPDSLCPDGDRLHQYVLHPNQERMPGVSFGMADLPQGVFEIARFYHLNALRCAKYVEKQKDRRVRDMEDGRVVWRGGGNTFVSEIEPLSESLVPESILALDRASL